MPQLYRAIHHSLATVTAWQGEELVGLIRVIGDGETILYIQDILVKPAYQNQKIGQTLVSSVLEDYPHVRQKVLLTEETPNVRRFYESFNFSSCDKGTTVAFYREY